MFPHIKPPAGTQINPLHPLSRGLVGCWLFNEGAGSLVNDISRNENHGRLTNMAPNVQGSGWGGSKFGGGLEFDGVNDYVDCGVIEIGTDFSISVWATFDNINSRYIVADTSDPTNLLVQGGGGGSLHAYVGGVYSDAYVLDTSLHQYTITNNASGIFNFYIDGEIFSVKSGTSFNANPNIIFGNNLDLTRGFDGSIRSINIYNRAKSADEVAWLYREPYAMFEPAFNPALLYSAAPPVGAIMNQFQRANIGADLYNGVFA